MILDFLIHKLTENKPPELNKDKCINYKKGDSCNKCKDFCTENAVHIKDNEVIINENKCNQCGICQVKCPTQAISIKGTGEEEILFAASEKKNLVFGCTLQDVTGNLYISCLNSLHPEVLALLFILYKEKEIYFNLSNCTDCELEIDNAIFNENLNKSISFVKCLGVDPSYEILKDENNISALITEEISRRNLFKLVKQESGSVVAKALNTIIDDKNQISYRSILLNYIKNLKVECEINYPDIFWEYWDVNIDCDVCGKCVSNCPGKAWNIESDDKSLKLYYNFSSCYKCGLCEEVCPKNAISKGKVNDFELTKCKLQKELHLATCKECNKKFVLHGMDEEKCNICKKKELLRKKITTSI